MINTLSYGECGEVVNTPGCEPGTRGFDSHHSPHVETQGLIPNQAFFCCSKRQILLIIAVFKFYASGINSLVMNFYGITDFTR